jgi:lysine-N-methylase
MSRFSCIGPACEDHCCYGWQVNVSQAQLARTRKVLRGDPAARQRFEDNIELRPPPERRRDKFARLRLLDDASCSMLDGDRLCSLQKGHGEEALPDICSVSPRQLFRAGDRVELTGAVGCPEVARLLLLAPDATDLVPVAPAVAGRPHEFPYLDPALPAPVVQRIEAVRARMHEVLGRGAFALSSRLYFTIELLNQLRGHAAGSPGGTALLEAMGEAALLEELDEHLRAQLPQIGLDIGPIIATVSLFQQEAPHAVFSGLAGAIVRSYLPEAPGGAAELPMPQVLAEYVRRRALVLGALGDRVDLYFQNYARHLWVKDWFGQMGGLDAYVRGQILRVTMLRFLLLSHPDAARAAQDPQGGAAALDALAVQIVYSFSRAMVNDDLQARFAALAAEQVADLPKAIALLAL